MSNKKIYSFKTVFLGDTSVGKSSISMRFTQDKFFEFQEPTIGAAFLAKTIELQNHNVKFEIWDTAGQERYHALAPMYYRGAKAALIVYDVTDPETFNKAKNWIKELQTKTENIYIILIGNKCDLQNLCDINHIDEYVERNNIKHFNVSAKENINVNELFNYLAENLPKLKLNDQNQDNVNSKNNIFNNRVCEPNVKCC